MAFDPNKPFTVLSEPDEPAVRGFDPSKPFTVVSEPEETPGNVGGIINAGRRAGRSSAAGLNVLGALGAGGKATDYSTQADTLEKQAAEIDTLQPNWSAENRAAWAKRAAATAVKLRERAGKMEGSQDSHLVDAAKHMKKAGEIPLSEDYQKYQDAEGFEAFKQFIKNPVEIPTAIAVEGAVGSAPALAAGALGAATAGPAGLAAGSGLGSFATEYASTMLDTLQARGVNIEDGKALGEAFRTPEFMEEARKRGLARGIPVAAFDAISGGLAGKMVAPVAKQGVKQVLKTAGKELAQQAGLGMAGETAGQTSDQLATTGKLDLSKLDLKSIAAEGIGEVVPGAGEVAAGAASRRMKGALDTGKNVKETAATLAAQQKQLVDGRRPAQMFPLGTDELVLPKGMERVETSRGVFHFNPAMINGDVVSSLSEAGRENELLGLGDYSKADIDQRVKAGEKQIALTERQPDGTEVKTAVASTGTAAKTAEQLERTKTPGNKIAVEDPAKVIETRTGKSFLTELLAKDGKEAQAARATAEKEQADRDQRQKELADKRALFDERVNTARAIYKKPDATFSEVQAALATTKNYAEDNSLGLDRDQRVIASQAAAALERKLAPLAEAEENAKAQRMAAAKAEQLAAEKVATAKRAAEKNEFKQAEKAGISADGGIDYAKLTDDQLVERINAGDDKADAFLMRRSAGVDATSTVSLMDALQNVRLPLNDNTLPGELKQLVFEDMTTAQRKKITSPRGMSLDRVAEALRGQGFPGIQTPNDVIEFTRRALKGEDIRAQREGGLMIEDDVPFAQSAPKPKGWEALDAVKPLRPQLNEREITQQMNAIRREFPALTRDIDIKAALVEDELRAAGYTGPVPETVNAAILRINAEKKLLVIATRAAQDSQAPGLFLHEMAHPFYDALPESTKEVLRELHSQEMENRTGPLFDKDGEILSGLVIRAEDFDPARLAANPDLPVQEWFAERVRILNDGWLQGKIPTDHTMIRQLWQQLLAYIRQIYARVRGLNQDGDLFTENFQRWLDTGARADMEAAGLAYAQRTRADFASLREESSPEDRKAFLLDELQRGREMRDAGDDKKEQAGIRIIRDVTEQLDEEFPDWETDSRQSNITGARALAPDDSTSQSGIDSETGEPSPFAPGESEEPLPIRAGKADEIYGHSAVKTPALVRTWERLRDVLVGARGALPELPTFPAAALNKADKFIQQHGPAFYNRIKEGYRALKSGNDYIQKTAEEQVAAVITPLMKAGEPINAAAYAKLRARQETARRLRADNKPVPAALTKEIRALNADLERNPYVLFNRLVLNLDHNWRHQNLRDSEGNPIRLPANINAAEIQSELQRLGEQLDAHPQGAAIQKAIEQHIALVKNVGEDLKSRELLAHEHLANPYYFPHLTLETERAGKIEQRELTPSRVRPGTEADFRGYLIDPVGSEKAIETDYLRAMYYHLVQVGAHNWKADVVKDFFRPYDVKADAEARAKALSKQRGVPVSWEQAFHEEFAPQGYVLYGTDSKDAFPSLEINRDALARRLGVMLTSEDIHKQLEQLGLKGIKLLPEDIKETMMQSGKETWIIPSRVADALSGITERTNKQNNAIEAASAWTLGKWKQWKLFMPWNHVRYEYGNIVADLEKIFSASPKTFLELPNSAKEIREFWLGGKPSDDLRAAVREGVINTITASEMHQLQRLRAFEQFETKAEKVVRQAKARSSSVLTQPVTNLFGLGDLSSVEVSAMREAITRFANFKANLEAIRNGARPYYGGAYWRDVEAMQDTRPGAGDADVRKAAAISKATFGDYGDLSVMGETMREKFIPFYSWMEVNFKYHANLLRNLRDMVRAGEMDKATAAKSGARSLGVLAAGASARVASGVVLRLALPYIAVALWNNSGDRDELEKLLSEEDRRRFHIILGTSEDGNATLRDGRKIQVVYGNTALADVTKWFSGPKFAQSMMGWFTGRTDFQTALSSWSDDLAPDFLNNTAGSFGPFAKIPYTLFAKKATFPDVTDQRTIPAYDMRRNIIGQMTDEFTADQIERVVNKDYYGSKDLGTWAKQLILQVRERDPQSWAFYSIKDKASSFLERKTGATRDMSYDAPDQQVLRNFRRAIYRGDAPNASKFYLRLLDLGYTSDRLVSSIRSQDPLSALPKENGLRREFVESLSPEDREQLRRAYEYYERMASSRGAERVLFPSKGSGERGLQRYQANPRNDRLEQIIQKSGLLSEEELERRAQINLRRSLQR